MSFETICLIGFVFGIGFGYFVQRSGLCFAHGLGEAFAGKPKRIIRLWIVIFAITSVGFVVSGLISPSLGLKPIGEIRAFGFFNLLAGMIFGAGILLNGGCVLGTLRQIGEGNLIMLVVLISFIPGMALVVYGIDPLLKEAYQVQNLLLPNFLSVPAVAVTGVLVVAVLIWYRSVRAGK